MTWRIIKKCAPLNTSKRKCHMYLNEKVKIESCKGDNLLSKCFELINKSRNQNKFTLLWHNSNKYQLRFHCNISAFPWRPPFLVCAINVLHNFVFKTKIVQLKTTILLDNIAGNIPCEHGTEMTSPINLYTLTLQFFHYRLLYFDWRLPPGMKL